MKVKDVISEGFASGFVRGLLPKAVQTALGGGRPQGTPDEKELAKQSFQSYGFNPGFYMDQFKQQISHLPEYMQAELLARAGEISWYTPMQMAQLERDVIKNQQYAKKQNVQTAQDEIVQAAGSSMLPKSPDPRQMAQGMFKNVYGKNPTVPPQSKGQPK